MVDRGVITDHHRETDGQTLH